jgi:hypothetical protein
MHFGSGSACRTRPPCQDQTPTPNIRLEPGRLEHLSAWVGQSGAGYQRASRSAAPRCPKLVESALGDLVSGDLCRQHPALRLALAILELSTSTFSCAETRTS